MNVLLHLYPGDAVAVLVANVAAQTTAVMFLALLAARRFAQGHPAARHALLLSALACVALSPAFSYLAYRADLAVFRIPASPGGPAAAQNRGPGEPEFVPVTMSEPARSPVAAAQPTRVWNRGEATPAARPIPGARGPRSYLAPPDRFWSQRTPGVVGALRGGAGLRDPGGDT